MISPGTITIDVKADTTQATKALTALRDAATLKVKPGFKTSELYAVLTPAVLTALTFVFHRDFSGYVQAAGLAVSGVAAAAYAVSRAHLKRPVDLASVLYDLRALAPIAADAEHVVAATEAVLPTPIVVPVA